MYGIDLIAGPRQDFVLLKRHEIVAMRNSLKFRVRHVVRALPPPRWFAVFVTDVLFQLDVRVFDYGIYGGLLEWVSNHIETPNTSMYNTKQKNLNNLTIFQTTTFTKLDIHSNQFFRLFEWPAFGGLKNWVYKYFIYFFIWLQQLYIYIYIR